MRLDMSRADLGAIPTESPTSPSSPITVKSTLDADVAGPLSVGHVVRGGNVDVTASSDAPITATYVQNRHECGRLALSPSSRPRFARDSTAAYVTSASGTVQNQKHRTAPCANVLLKISVIASVFLLLGWSWSDGDLATQDGSRIVIRTNRNHESIERVFAMTINRMGGEIIRSEKQSVTAKLPNVDGNIIMERDGDKFVLWSTKPNEELSKKSVLWIATNMKNYFESWQSSGNCKGFLPRRDC